MAYITRRRQGVILRGIFEILRRHPDGVLARDLLKELERVVPPTSFELSHYPAHPGLRRYEKIVRFATVAPVKAGWMAKNRGVWTVLPAGLAAADKIVDDEALYKEAFRLYRQWAKGRPSGATSDEEEAVEEHPPAQVTLEEAEETARSEIREYLSRMPPYEFQSLVATLLQAMGYHVPWVAPPGRDRGLDIIAFQDPLGASGPRIKVQVKRREETLGVPEVRAFVALLGANDSGVFVTTGRFTTDAMEEIRSLESRRLQLIDGDAFIDLWIARYDSMPETAKELLPLKPIYYLATPQ